MTSNILFYEKPLILNVELAKLIGLNESIVLQQMQYWLEKSSHIIDGVKWIYNTYAQWKEQFPFFSESTIRRIIKRLEDKDIIRSSNFNKSKMDNTKWYTINYDFFCSIQHEQSPSQDEAQNCSIWSEDQPNLNKAIPENTTETNLQELVLKEKQAASKDNTSTSSIEAKDEAEFKNICNFFSSNMHLLTPFEYTKMQSLYQEFKDKDLIIKAIEVAIANGAKNLRYIEATLYHWKEQNITTAEAAQKQLNEHLKKGAKNNYGGKNNNSSYKSHSSSHREDASKKQSKWAGYKAPEPDVPEEPICCEGLI
ncbi:MAG: DnaD domain protein [Bacillota bacterium]|nr:DnaD domain protein [Bacillota bacterium]